MAARRSWFTRKDTRTDRLGIIDLERNVAEVHNSLVRNKRPYLVDSVRDLSLRRVAVSESGAIAISPNLNA